MRIRKQLRGKTKPRPPLHERRLTLLQSLFSRLQTPSIAPFICQISSLYYYSDQTSYQRTSLFQLSLHDCPPLHSNWNIHSDSTCDFSTHTNSSAFITDCYTGPSALTKDRDCLSPLRLRGHNCLPPSISHNVSNVTFKHIIFSHPWSKSHRHRIRKEVPRGSPVVNTPSALRFYLIDCYTAID